MTVRWSLSPTDFKAHALVDQGEPLAVLTTRCGAQMPVEAGIDTSPRAALCPACVRVIATPARPVRPGGARR